MESKIVSSTGFLHQFSIEELYVLTTHWQSDITFFEQEISYFQSLIARYFLPGAEKDNMIVIKSMDAQFKSLGVRKEQLKADILSHQKKLSDLLNSDRSENESACNVNHFALEGKLFDFIKALRQIKLEFFNATKFSGHPRKLKSYTSS